MRNFSKLFGIIALVAIMVSLAGCVTASAIGGEYPHPDGHGLFNIGNATADAIGGQEIGSYQIILGLVDTGYAEYVAAVKAAEASGKKIATTTTNLLGIIVTVRAYSR